MTQAEQQENIDPEFALGDDPDGQGSPDLAGDPPDGQDPQDPPVDPTAADEEIDISIDGEPPTPEEAEEQAAPQWVREVRKTNREQAKKIRELEAQLNTKPQPQAVVVGAKPTLAACDYDEDRFDAELTQWHERKRTADAEEQRKRDEAENAQKAWQTKLDDYGKQKSTLKVRDFEDAEAQAQEVLSVTQQGIILSGADAPAMLVYALGKNPKKAKELASISDPVKFAVAIGKLETQLKATPRKAAPLPESAVKGSGRAVNNQTLERLEAEAMRSGDRSKVIAYKRQMKAKP